MTIRSSPAGLVVRALVAAALTLAGLGAAAPARAGLVDDVLCAVTSLAEPVRLGDALQSGLSMSVLRTHNALSTDELQHLAEDDTTWVDPCARVFVVDEAAPPAQQDAVAVAPAAGVPADVFDLSSRPGSTRTIYLDFDGATYAGTRWRNGEQIVSAPFSVDDDPSTFSDVERAQIYLAWQTVAEDYAPFDVNVTTRQPAASALTRSSASDPTFGMPVVITPTNSVGSGCGCGGMAYVGVMGNAGANDYQPAWIFTSGSGTNGYNVGQVISHEVGHTFGLHHDGTSQTSYYSGAKDWAPIMGSSYNRRASQWSRGDYPDASNTEDDVAIISQVAPALADDHANGAVGATKIAVGTTTAGVIGTRTDVDAFTFTAGGPITLAVAGPAGYSNLDVRLTVLDALGRTVATLDPTADSASDASMSALWSVELPASATYTALVEGVGNGDPAEAGRYSDYGSLGSYTVSLSAGLTATPPPVTSTPPASTTPPTAPTVGSTAPVGTAKDMPGTGGTRATPSIEFVTRTLPAARVGRTYRAEIRFTGAVSEARLDWRLPQGLRWRVVGERIVIRGRATTRTTSKVTAELSGAGGSTRMKFRLVVR
ncbi:hypothetical protein F4692_003842 [Nocardioides cavernae]|uniref:Peptidase C-terminal archaeal/bacterial domain-containing protein n=1 Tax=Nocardioides cavernae TaxID=1921566 RepID=A0A7Y9H692_9ACTN|nr:M12 family metallo-peptidase [Nocardioides cavernae]NYE38692.1 hypothetical protein [Nocardioides cavernae]